MLGLGSINPGSVLAADTQKKAGSGQEISNNRKDNRTSFDEIMKNANAKWNSLSNEQKNEIYDLVEKELRVEMQLLDKMVELGVMEKNDVALIKNNMQMRLDNLRSSGQFPFVRQRSPKGSK
jgi:Tfp pilus assembly pilus retraction ATPase PilT